MALKYLNGFVKQFSDAISPSFVGTKNEFLEQFHEALSVALEKLDLVSRQEFDTQTALLKKTQLKLLQLEQKLSLIKESNTDISPDSIKQ